MGAAEKAFARKAALEKSEKLTAALENLKQEHEEAIETLAKEHQVTAQCIRKLLNEAPALKEKKAVSNYNLVVNFKMTELNEGMSVPNIVQFEKLIFFLIPKAKLQVNASRSGIFTRLFTMTKKCKSS